MNGEEFPLLRGTITHQERYRSPQGGPTNAPPLPDRNPPTHSAALLAQLDQIVAAAGQRPDRDPEATREIIAVRPAPGTELPMESLADKRSDVRVVSADDETGLILLDAASADLAFLRRKVQHYGDDDRVRTSGARSNEPLVSRIEGTTLATLEDLAGPRLRASEIAPNAAAWWEITCRGGAHASPEELASTRRQLDRVLEEKAISRQEFNGTGQLFVFSRMTLLDLRELVARTDCVYECDLAGPEIGTWLTMRQLDTVIEQLPDFQLTPPAADAPAVVLLDSGIASAHPMLAGAILSEISALDEDPSPADVAGHGTSMAGIVLFDDVNTVAATNGATAGHWVQSAKIIRHDNEGAAAEDGRQFWPLITERGVLGSETDARPRVFCMAVTAPLDEPPNATSWSHGVDQLAYNAGAGRLFVVAIGNTDPGDHVVLAAGYPHLNLDASLDDPAQAANALTVGAYSKLMELPPEEAGMTVVTPTDGISLCTRAGIRGAGSAVKPEVLFEGGNAATDGAMIYSDLDTLGMLSTGHEFLARPLVVHHMTSLAAANASRFAAQVWSRYPDLWPQTIRALIVHSAGWTDKMKEQFPNIDDRMSVCGYGVPDLAFARGCLGERATVIIQDSMPNAVLEQVGDETKKRRYAKFFELPTPEGVLDNSDEVGLRVTLSYFAEPNTFRRRVYRGMDLAWDMQGPHEDEVEFRTRINRLLREPAGGQGFAGSFDWRIGKNRRGRGTVQSDRWTGTGAFLSSPKLIAVYPRTGWWDRRAALETNGMRFSLVATLTAPGIDVYTPIQQALGVPVEIPA